MKLGTDKDYPVARQPRTSLVLGWRLALMALLVGFLVLPSCSLLLKRFGMWGAVPLMAQPQPDYLLVLRNPREQCLPRALRAGFHILEAQIREAEKAVLYIVAPPPGMLPSAAADLVQDICAQSIDRPTLLEVDAYRLDLTARLNASRKP